MIFVQIASYKDPELFNTINDMVDNAKNPDQLNITVCWQHGDEQTVDDFLDNGMFFTNYIDYSHKNPDDTVNTFQVMDGLCGDANVKVIDVNYMDTRGACWARNLIQQFYDKEDYTLQLDSHHRFAKHWDVTCIEMLNGLKQKSKKPLLTAYVPSYNPETDPKGRVQVPWKMNFDRFIPEGAVFFLPSSIDNFKSLKNPIPARFYSAHFCFTDGKFVEEVPHDPEYFFHGEEISIAVRAFTHGYDLYHPHRIVCWHEYTRKNRKKVWDDHVDKEKAAGKIELNWVDRNNNSHKRNRILFGMDGEDPNQIDFGKYGFGTERTVRQYEEYAGISFKYRGVQQFTVDKNDPPNPQSYTTEEEWKDSFTNSVDIRILVKKSELGEIPDDCNFCFVGLHDKNGTEIHRKDFDKKEFYKKFNDGNEWIDYQYICLTDKIPASYTLWPHSKSKGWLNKVTKPIQKQ